MSLFSRDKGVSERERAMEIKIKELQRSLVWIEPRLSALEAQVQEDRDRVSIMARRNSNEWHHCEYMPSKIGGCQMSWRGGWYLLSAVGKGLVSDITHCPYCGEKLPLEEQETGA